MHTNIHGLNMETNMHTSMQTNIRTTIEMPLQNESCSKALELLSKN